MAGEPLVVLLVDAGHDPKSLQHQDLALGNSKLNVGMPFANIQ